MIDLDTLKATTDCRTMVEQDLGAPLNHTQAYTTWRCPFHNEHTPGGFRVWVDGYKCFSCGKHGDVVSWLTEYRKLDFTQAITLLNGGQPVNIKPPDRVEQARVNAERAAVELEQKITKAQAALTELRAAQSWLRYHNQLTADARKTWASWGVNEFFQDFWQLGYDPCHTVWTDTGEWMTPTYTIPVFEPESWAVLNVRHRLVNPPKPGDKYRPERSGLPAAFWIADPDRSLKGAAMIVEGEKKAMVSYITADNPELRVIGVPGKNPSIEQFTRLRDCEPVYICLDPDAHAEAIKMAGILGAKRCRLIELPEKVDDLILRLRLNKRWMSEVLRQAVRCG
jgi:hypothetical protein